MVGGDRDLLRDCNNELAVKAQSPLWRFWIILHFLAKLFLSRPTQVLYMVLLMLLQGRLISLWVNKLEVWTQNVIMYIVTVFVLMFYFTTWDMYNNEPQEHKRTAMCDKWFAYVSVNG